MRTKKVLATYFGKGSQHDFILFKCSKTNILECIRLFIDKGYQGICKLHSNSCIPIKKPRKRYLTKLEKKYNQQLSKQRIYVEHVIRSLKIFRILSERYRNRRKRFALRFNLIAALYNFQIR